MRYFTHLSSKHWNQPLLPRVGCWLRGPAWHDSDVLGVCVLSIFGQQSSCGCEVPDAALHHAQKAQHNRAPCRKISPLGKEQRPSIEVQPLFTCFISAFLVGSGLHLTSRVSCSTDKISDHDCIGGMSSCMHASYKKSNLWYKFVPRMPVGKIKASWNL